MLLHVIDRAYERGDVGFNGHPPLGVNATVVRFAIMVALPFRLFQRAPTLGGECYY